MTKIYWCSVLAGLLLTLCSFSCSKQEDDVLAASRVQSEDKANVIVDFRNFPARTQFVLYPKTGSTIKFDSDSLKYYEVYLPQDVTYNVEWRIINVASDPNYKAKWLNSAAGTSVAWESAMYTYKDRYIHGTYTFTKEKR